MHVHRGKLEKSNLVQRFYSLKVEEEKDLSN